MAGAASLAATYVTTWLYWWQVPLLLLAVVLPAAVVGVVLLTVGITGKNRGLRPAGLAVLISLGVLALLAVIGLALPLLAA